MTVDDKITAWVTATAITPARAAKMRNILARWFGNKALSAEYVSHSVVGDVYTLRVERPAPQADLVFDGGNEDVELSIHWV